ncbi:MAG: phytanoyl-CoA dioxygenase family protein [Candidatus Binatia bacterium]|nr:phytanoyl-CoA dioxygenase family protein [Candidatus Binatia bacterium]
MAATFAPLDFDSFHREELPRRLAAGNGALAARGAERLPALAFRRQEGGSYTYVPGQKGIEVVADEAAADLVIEVTDEIWQNIVNELDAAAGLLYGGRAKCVRGDAIRWLDWEPALRAMFSGRPVYDASDVRLLDRVGAPLDPEHTFTLDDGHEDMAHFLRTAGYLFVREVFSAGEVERFLAEAAELRGEAVKGDKLSWWGKDDRGEDILCRVTRAGAKPNLRSIPTDSRLLDLKDLADEPLAHRASASPEQSITVIWKNPNMCEGLGDLPWHRDCGMGGHAAMCPVLIASVFLTPSNPDAGDLRFLPGSWQAGCGPIDPNHPKAPRGAIFNAEAGDVSLHYGDTMHAAPSPASAGVDTYRISAVTGYTRPGTRPHRGKNYNEVLHSRDDGQVEHLEKVARKS